MFTSQSPESGTLDGKGDCGCDQAMSLMIRIHPKRSQGLSSVEGRRASHIRDTAASDTPSEEGPLAKGCWHPEKG